MVGEVFYRAGDLMGNIAPKITGRALITDPLAECLKSLQFLWVIVLRRKKKIFEL